MWYLLYILWHTARRSLLFASQPFCFLPSGRWSHFDFKVNPLNIFDKRSTKKKLGARCWLLLFQIIFLLHKVQLNSQPMSNLWGHFPKMEHWLDDSKASLFPRPGATFQVWCNEIDFIGKIRAIFSLSNKVKQGINSKSGSLVTYSPFQVCLYCSALHFMYSRTYKSTLVDTVCTNSDHGLIWYLL